MSADMLGILHLHQSTHWTMFRFQLVVESDSNVLSTLFRRNKPKQIKIDIFNSIQILALWFKTNISDMMGMLQIDRVRILTNVQ